MPSIGQIQNPAIERLTQSQNPAASPIKADESREDFAQMLMDALKEVNAGQQDARQAQNDFLTGQRSMDLHTLMIKLENASVMMNLTMQVRNKLLEAYQEINRMQV